MTIHQIQVCISVLVSFLCFASVEVSAAIQSDVAWSRLTDAISPEDGARGSVMASPSRSYPDYYYHWTRDAALVMKEVFLERDRAPEWVENVLKDYAQFSRRNQLTANLGEPKFYMDGSEYKYDWGRPQNDGPALRALTLIEFARYLKKNGQQDWVNAYLYKAEIPATTVIKADLEYVSHHWQEPNFDIWEEVYGHHFYTRIVQARSLEVGAEFALEEGDPEAALWYAGESKKIYASLEQFWSPERQIIEVTQKRLRGLYTKHSGLDSAVILGVLHADIPAGRPFGFDDIRVYKTAKAIEASFAALYAVNQVSQDKKGNRMAPAIGRYPEDKYDGVSTDKLGNPWFLTTHAFAEFYFKIGFEQKAQEFMNRSQYHTAVGGRQSEQIDRVYGVMRGARDLTWSYASFLSAHRASLQKKSNQK